MTTSAAGLAFHGFLAIVPAVIAGVGLARLAGLSPGGFAALVRDLTAVLPRSASSALVVALRSSGSTRADLIAVIAGATVALWSAVELMAALQQSIDVAFGLRRRHDFLSRRLVALPLLAITVVLGVAATGLLVFGAELETIVSNSLPPSFHHAVFVFGDLIRALGSLIAVVILLSLFYGVSRRESFRDWRLLSVGSILATAGWIASSVVYSIYLTHSAGESRTYGSLAGVAVLLLWLYITFAFVLLGAELDRLIEGSHLTQPGNQQCWEPSLQVAKDQRNQDQDRPQ